MFNMELQNVSQLEAKHEISQIFNIRGWEWYFRIMKLAVCQRENETEDTICVLLLCDIPNNLKNYMCGARAKIELVSSNSKSHHGCLSAVYDSENAYWSFDSFIEWKELFKNGYVQDRA